jgi:hypothetical protein
MGVPLAIVSVYQTLAQMAAGVYVQGSFVSATASLRDFFWVGLTSLLCFGTSFVGNGPSSVDRPIDESRYLSGERLSHDVTLRHGNVIRKGQLVQNCPIRSYWVQPHSTVEPIMSRAEVPPQLKGSRALSFVVLSSNVDRAFSTLQHICCSYYQLSYLGCLSPRLRPVPFHRKQKGLASHGIGRVHP